MININLPIYTCILKYFEKLLTFNNLFTLDLYNGKWLLDVVTVNPLNKKDDILSSQRFRFCRRTCFMYIYLYIDVAMCLMALVEILRITLIIIEKCKRYSLMYISVFIVLL